MKKIDIKSFLKNNAPYIFGGAAIAVLTMAAQFLLMMGMHSLYSSYFTGLGSHGNTTALYYLSQLVAFAVVIGGTFLLFRAGKVPRPLPLSFLGIGIFSMLHVFVPWVLWRYMIWPGLPGYVLSEALYGAISFVLARYALRKIQQNAAAYMIGVTLIIGSYILPMIILQLLFRGSWN